MEFLERIRATIAKYDLIRTGDHVLVGLSGGPDSVCLLTALDRLKPPYNLTLTAVYLDHGLRPGETPAEKDFCSDLCGSLAVPFLTRNLNVIEHGALHKMSIQESGRELRYRAFQEIAAEISAAKIALGHHADDQAETMLMRLFRGTGPSGMAGIPPVRKNIIRPLIETERHHIEAFLDADGIAFMVDSSNLRNDYLRNKLRHFVMPAVKQLNRDVIKTMCRTADICREEERYFEVLITKTLMKLISRKSATSIELFMTPMEAMDPVILRRLLRRALDETRGLREIGFIHVEEIMHLIKSAAAGDRIYLPGNCRAIKQYSTLLITADPPHKIQPATFDGRSQLPLAEAEMVLLPSVLPRREWDNNPGDGKNMAVLDAGKLSFPLMLRSRKPGDCFYPMGFGKRKKLQDYFVDEKVPRDERDAVPLLVSNDQVVWVVGHRVDARFGVDGSTEQILRIVTRPLKI
ncbi:MAG TPA: tRNA lysidine(34) synthetase TilS [Dissulfurispiraceae bacterium]|nr:tRNA lysidine(34) synthetase TilS [Dissulfurispiraceae bacterium]